MLSGYLKNTSEAIVFSKLTFDVSSIGVVRELIRLSRLPVPCDKQAEAILTNKTNILILPAIVKYLIKMLQG